MRRIGWQFSKIRGIIWLCQKKAVYLPDFSRVLEIRAREWTKIC